MLARPSEWILQTPDAVVDSGEGERKGMDKERKQRSFLCCGKRGGSAVHGPGRSEQQATPEWNIWHSTPADAFRPRHLPPGIASCHLLSRLDSVLLDY